MMHVCPEQVGGAPSTPPLTDERLSKLYDFLLDQRDCLIAEGYSIAEPPSRETFISGYTSGSPWIPYTELPVLGAEEFFELEKKCPQSPPDRVLE